jgi:coproporphyrinogen III oxidase
MTDKDPSGATEYNNDKHNCDATFYLLMREIARGNGLCGETLMKLIIKLVVYLC